MLILTRRAGETVMIGSDVTITVLGVKGNQVRIGINAPKDVAVHREEILRANPERKVWWRCRRAGLKTRPISSEFRFTFTPNTDSTMCGFSGRATARPAYRRDG